MILINIPIVRQVCLLAIVFVITCCECSAQAKTFSKEDFQELDNLLGIWKTEKKNGVLYEAWVKVSDNELQGKSFKIAGADTIILERVRLAQDQNFQIIYAVRVDGENDGKETLFHLSKVTDSDYIFENLKHDFPKRIVYVIPKSDVLHAYIEGEIEGKNQRSDFNFARVLQKK